MSIRAADYVSVRERISDAFNSPSDAKCFAAIGLVIILSVAALVGLIVLTAWHWWLGVPVIAWLIWRLWLYVMTDEDE